MPPSATSFFASFISSETQNRVKKEEAEELPDRIDGLTDAFRKCLVENIHLEQRGVMRSNCIDCLDRTNVAQFFLSFTVVYRMLFVLGIEFSPNTPDFSPLQQLLVNMWRWIADVMARYKELGDVISLQYGGSNAHDKIEITRGNKKRKEIFTTILRHYNNTFTDKVKQEAYNVFLGVFDPMQHSYLLSTSNGKTNYDYYLHNHGYEDTEPVQILPPQKWWFAPLLAYETGISGDPWKPLRVPGCTDRCPCCSKQSPIHHTLLCAYCGALLRHSLPALPRTSFCENESERGLLWEQLVDSESM